MKSDRAFKIAMALIVLVALGLGVCLAWSQADNLYIKLALWVFERDPSQTTAETLVDLLDRQVASLKQARHIMVKLFTPKVTVADFYVLGTVPKVRVEHPFEFAFHNMIGDVTEEVYVGGQHQYGTGSQGLRTFEARTHSLGLHPVPTEAGVYTMEIRYSYCLTGTRKLAWQWHSFKGIPWPRRRLVDISEVPLSGRQYTCHIVIPLRISVKRPSQ